MHIILIALNCRYSHSCPALFYVRNELEKHLSCRTTIKQFTINDPYYETFLQLSDNDASYLLFSVYIWNADYVERLVTDLYIIRPKLKVILGGPQAPAMKNLPESCSVIQGEIEGAPKQFYTDLRQKKPARKYRAVSGQRFFSPYRDDDFRFALKDRNIYYESSRGCPFACAYCLSSTSRGIFTIGLDQVREELGLIVAHRPKLLKFVDRTFNAEPNRTLAIWRYLAGLAGETMFHFEIAPDLFNEEMFAFLADLPPGKFQFEIGIQSTNPETLAAVNRKMDLELAERNVKRLSSMDNIHLHLDLILGLPFETKKSFSQSVNFVFGLRPHYVQMGLLKVLPDTPMSIDRAGNGLVHCHKPPYQVTETKWLPHRELSHLYWLGECVESFYNNRYFRSFFNYVRKTETDFFHFFEKLLLFCQKKDFSQRAKTQQFLNGLLVEFIYSGSSHQKDMEGDFLRELLIFDWLSCGHRQLPDELHAGSLTIFRNTAWQNMPENAPGLYNYQDHNEFFKKGVFFRFSALVLDEIEVAGSKGMGGYVCFLPQSATGIFNRFKALYLGGYSTALGESPGLIG
jgi:hypothetical protein